MLKWIFCCIFGYLLLQASSIRAELVFASPIARLGEIKTSSPLTYNFHFENKGNQPVEILETRAGCGCVIPKLPAKMISPGGKGKIPVQIKTLGQPAGPKRWYVYVRYKTGEKIQQIALEIMVDLVTEVTVQPASLTLQIRGEFAQKLKALDFREKPFAIKKVCCSAPFMSTNLGSRFRNKKGYWQFPIVLTISDECPKGRHEEILSIYTEDPLYRQIDVPITINKRPTNGLIASPNALRFFPPPGQQRVSRRVLIRNTSGEKIRISKVTSDHPAILPRWSLSEAEMVSLRIDVDLTKIKSPLLKSHVSVQVGSKEVRIPVLIDLSP